MKITHQTFPQHIGLDHLKKAIDKLDKCVDLLRAVYMDLDLINEVFLITNASEKREKDRHQ